MRKQLLGLCLALTISSAAVADPDCQALNANTNSPLSLQELVDAALTCNPNTQIAWAQYKINEANVGISESNYWPQVNGQVNAAYTRKGGSFFSMPPTNNSTQNITATNFSNTGQFSYTPTIGISYLLVDFGNTRNRVKAAKLSALASEFSKDYTAQQTILQVEQSYYAVLANKAMLDAAQTMLKQAKDSLDAATLMHKVGTETIGDVYQAESSYAQAKLNLKQDQGSYAIAKGQLNTAIGISVATNLTLAPLPAQIETQKALQSVNQLLDNAEQDRPDLAAARKQVEANQANYAAVKAQAWPTLTFNATAGSTLPGSVQNSGLTRTASLVLNVPLFTGFQQKYNEEKAEETIDQSIAQQNQLANQIELQVWQAYYNLKTASQSLDSSNELLTSSIQAGRQAIGQYRAGVGNILTVLTTQATESNARAQNIQAKLNWYTALVQLDAALGTLSS